MKWKALAHHEYPGGGLLSEIRHTLDIQNLRVLRALARRSNFQPAADPAVTPSFNADVQENFDAESIPKIIYQTWKSTELPANYLYWHGTLRSLNPDFTSVIWTDEKNRLFVSEYFPGILPLYNSFPKEIFRVDFIRPLFMLQFGGYYFDLDCEAVRPIDRTWQSKPLLLGEMGDHVLFPHSIPNASFGSRPGEVFWLIYIGYMIEVSDAMSIGMMETTGPETITGPIALWRSIQRWRELSPDERRLRASEVVHKLGAVKLPSLLYDDVQLVAKNEMFALDWNNRIHQRLIRFMRDEQVVLRPEAAQKLFPRAITTTYWSHTW